MITASKARNKQGAFHNSGLFRFYSLLFVRISINGMETLRHVRHLWHRGCLFVQILLLCYSFGFPLTGEQTLRHVRHLWHRGRPSPPVSGTGIRHCATIASVAGPRLIRSFMLRGASRAQCVRERCPRPSPALRRAVPDAPRRPAKPRSGRPAARCAPARPV